MKSTPIQVTDEGVFIPREYLADAAEYEIEIQGDYLIVRPKQNQGQKEPLTLQEKHAADYAPIPQDKEEVLEQQELQHDDDPEIYAERNESEESDSWIESIIGIAESKDPTASSRVKEILAAEIDRRSGWTLNKLPKDDE